MKYPKGFNKWSLDEQESWLSKQRSSILDELDKVSKQLARVRGGMKIEALTDDRPDLLMMKAGEGI
jgi:hypothetical protein